MITSQSLFIILFLKFIKYVDIETVFTKSNQTKKTSKVTKGKIVNSTNLDITYLDLTWFTDYIVNCHWVSEHWRWQRYGPGLSEKKLIIIPMHKRGTHIRKHKRPDNELD